MRSSFGFALPLLVMACGGSTSSPVTGDDHVPATALPDEQLSTSDRGPTGFVTMLTINGELNVPTPAFYEDAERTRDWSGTSCALRRNGSEDGSERASEVSAGTVTFTIPTRDGDVMVDVPFDPRAGEYAFATHDGAIEPGGLLRVSAEGDVAPAFEADVEIAANVAFDGPETVTLDGATPQDFTLRWTADGANDEVFADIAIGDTHVTCWFDSRKGAGTVPATLLSALVKDPAAATCDRSACYVFLASKRMRSVTVRDWTMVISHGFATMKDVRVTR